jgi:hypothetical protein
VSTDRRIGVAFMVAFCALVPGRFDTASAASASHDDRRRPLASRRSAARERAAQLRDRRRAGPALVVQPGAEPVRDAASAQRDAPVRGPLP